MSLKGVLFSFNNCLSLLIVVTEILGDYLVNKSQVHIIKALFDNATHSLVGGLCWLQFSLHFKAQVLLEAFICALLSSLIDLDHFYSARSLNLKDATSLPHRPPLHCTTIPLLLFMLLIALSYGLKMAILKKVAFLIFIAFISHHTRDATRRGYWLYPFGSTPPVPYTMYIFLTVLIPYIAIFLDNRFKFDDSYVVDKSSVIEV